MRDIRRKPAEIGAELCREFEADHACGNKDIGSYSALHGGALLNRYMYILEPDDRFLANANKYTSLLAIGAGRFHLYPLYNGATGVGWLLHHMARLNGEIADTSDLDIMLLRNLERRWGNRYDLIGSLVGIGLYALENGSKANSKLLLRNVVLQLHNISIEHDGARLWFTPPELIPPSQIESAPHGYFNLGMAHGIPGVVQVLAAAVSRDVEAGKASRLLDGAVPWVFSKLRQIDEGWILPSNTEATKYLKRRLAWCYNELGGMVGPLSAGLALGRQDWVTRVKEVIDTTLGTSIEATRVLDAGLCHGVAGIAHLYNWFGRVLQQAAYIEEAETWMQRVFLFYDNGRTRGFYKYELDPLTSESARIHTYSFLEGSSGVVLAMLSHWCSIPTDWERLLGLWNPRENTTTKK